MKLITIDKGRDIGRVVNEQHSAMMVTVRTYYERLQPDMRNLVYMYRGYVLVK